MKHLSLLITSIITFLLVSCVSRESQELFARVESLMDENPDSALAMLDSMASEKSTYSKALRMRYELLHAKAQNKAYVDFTSDSIMKEVVAYYDAHGTANEQVEAHYLMGCVYRDLKESPMALQCYLDATEKADTLSADCDYGMLMRVWGQIANEFDRQAMPYKELEAIQEYENLAIKCNDSVSYAIGVERKCNAYTLLHDTTNIIRYTKKASNLLYKLGRHSQSTFVLSTLIPIYIEKGEVTKAEHLIKTFEKDTNFFTINGDIIKGREFYYCAKAKYFEKTNRLDSAELYYRKLYKYGYQYDACCGLLDIYTELMCMDSVYKYSKLKDKASIMKYTELHTQAMFNADGMFNYTRNQRIAMGLQIEKEHIRTRALTIGSIGLCLMILGVMTLIRYKERKKREIEAISLKYRESKQIYKKAIVDYTLMEKDFEEYKAQKAKEIELLGELNRNASTTYEHTNRRHILTSLCSHDIVKQILKNENIGHNHRSEISVRQWNDLYNLFEKEVPQLYNTYINNHKLSDRERKTLVLTSLGINTNNIAILLNTTASNISNIKTCINQKLFSDSSAKKLYDNLILA